MKVVAVDPGTHTGIAWGEFTSRRDRPTTFGVEQVNCPEEDEGLFRIWSVIEREEPDVLIVEDFILLPPEAMKRKGGWSSKRSGLSSTRLGFGIKLLVGIAQNRRDYWSWLDGDSLWVPPAITWQMPSMMAAVPESYLRSQGLWRTPTQIPGSKPGDGPHAMDALRHLLVWARKGS